ncbi:MAG: hypothetical protein GXP38_09435, partial [Chloroflexi bacterium]|nr:hypothetical protein [Chloroflexota bacterium]
MKKQIAIWTTVILLGAVVVYTLVRLPGDTSVPQSPPDFSLSRGPTGMVDGSASYFFSYNDSVGSPIPPDQLIATIQSYLRSQGDENLKVVRLREFVWVYQAEIVERSTGRNAFGLMISKYTGQISPKAGPNIFWNTRYGSKIAEVGGGYGMVGRLLPLPPQQEIALAEEAARQIAASAIKEVDSTL